MTTSQLPLQHNVKARGSGRRQHRYRSPKTVVPRDGARSAELDRIGVHREAEIAIEHQRAALGNHLSQDPAG